jgi:hypothetical protein
MLTVAGLQAMKDPTEEPLNGGVSTHWWSHTPARGLVTASSLSLIRSPWLSLRRGREMRECARVRRRKN